jgi:hypothetical protein
MIIIKMIDVLVPTKLGMRISCHHDVKVYAKQVLFLPFFLILFYHVIDFASLDKFFFTIISL